jgi:transcriptional regulator with XRE-family HTH domain
MTRYNNFRDFISRRIKQARKESRMTQQEVSDELGVTQSQVAHYESGRDPIGIDQLIILRDIFDKPFAYFLLREEPTQIEDLPPTLERIIALLWDLGVEDRNRILDFAEYIADLAARNKDGTAQ